MSRFAIASMLTVMLGACGASEPRAVPAEVHIDWPDAGVTAAPAPAEGPASEALPDAAPGDASAVE